MIFENNKGTWELPEILNYEEYSYNLSCRCDECDYYLQHHFLEGLVGYCSTENGHFLCFVCPKCGSKYRYHYTSNGERGGDFEQWKKDVALYLCVGKYDHFKIN